MNVRAKMVVSGKADAYQQWNKEKTTQITLSVVTGDENKTWSKYTPNGQVTLSITNPAAIDAFELGKTYFVDFSLAPATEAEEVGRATA